MMARVAGRALALCCLAALAAALSVYPLQRGLAALLCAAYMALLYWRPAAWLLVLPALLPVLDLAPWTGWFYLEESDLLVLATAAAGYWFGAGARRAALPRFFTLALALVAVSTAIAAWRGLLPLAPLDANSFANYQSRFNGLREAKGFAWALLLLPLLRRDAGPGLAGLERWFVPGMLLGLAGVCLAVVWERAAFPGLLNFASDYRPTAPFSAMHTGGAALDAYLALAFPFVAAWLRRGATPARLGLGVLLLVLGLYAGLATFSRDMYLAYAVSGAVLGALLLIRRARRGTLDTRLLLATLGLALAALWVLLRVFASGGYRTLAAALVLLVAAMIVATVRRPLRLAALAPAALLLVGANAACYLLASGLNGIAKGPYLGFTLATAAFAAGAAWLWLAPCAAAMLLAGAALPALASGTALVAWWWGGAPALADAGLAIALAAALVGLNRARPLWRATPATFAASACGALVCAIAIPLLGSYYLGARFATSGSDMQVRVQHWSEALGMIDDGWQASLLGMGLGRFPDTYFWNNRHGETPARLSYETQGSNQYLRLVSGTYAAGFGETLRVLQHVGVAAGQRYRLAFDARRTSPKATLNAQVCERWLLYPQNCAQPALRLAPPDGAWHHYEIALPAGAWRGGALGPTTQLELSNGGVGGASVLDLDNVSLQASGGAELVRNGAFSYGQDGWFFTSDRNHMPWHVKNFAVNMRFEQGWLGSIAIGLLLLFAAGDMALRALHGERLAASGLAALCGIMVVGLFDSLVDVPRLTLALLLVLGATLLRPAPAPLRRRPT